MKKLVLISVAIAAIGAGLWFGRTLLYPAKAEAMEFSLPDIQGKMHKLSDWRNRVVVVNFWATWCPPCREEIPAFIELQKRYGDRDIHIVGVAVDNLQDVAEFYKSESMNYQVLVGEDDAINIMADFGDTSGSLPYSVVLDGDGNIVAHKLGAMSLPQMENMLKPYLTPRGLNSGRG